VQPVLPWLDAHLGGHYSQFDDATWGHGILGAHAWLPMDLGHLQLRYEGGAGDGMTPGIMRTTSATPAGSARRTSIGSDSTPA
jgi:hypothetical protein